MRLQLAFCMAAQMYVLKKASLTLNIDESSDANLFLLGNTARLFPTENQMCLR